MANSTFSSDPFGYLVGLSLEQRDGLLAALRQFHFDTGYSALLTSTSTALSFNYFLSWVIVFLALYVLFAGMWKLLPGSGLSEGRKPAVASSRCIGTIHCLIVVPLSILALNRRNSNWLHLTYLDANSALEQRIIELSVGYFVADFVHFILFEPDFLMFFHHVFSILMMGSAGVIGRGAACGTSALVQGEITNPFQSAWTVARTAKAEKLLVWLSPLFTVVFVIVRLFGVPTWTGILLYDLWSTPNRKLMPTGVVEWWSAMAVFMTLGGFVWSYSLLKGLRKYYQNKGRATGKESKKRQ